MKILVLGATGGIGQQVVKLALEHGHAVTALVRNPQKLGLSHDNLRVVSGDVLNRQNVEEALDGVSVVVSTLGVQPRKSSEHLIERAIEELVPAMKRVGVRRLIFTSGIVVKTSQLAFFPRALMRVLMRFVMSDQVEDKMAGEEILRRSDLDWTLLYPTILTDGPQTGRYRSGEDIKLHGLPKVSRADVATFILTLLTQPESIRREIFVSY